MDVNDGVITGSNDSILRKLEAALKDCLKIIWQEDVEVTCDHEEFTLQQKKLIDKLLLEHWDKQGEGSFLVYSYL